MGKKTGTVLVGFDRYHMRAVYNPGHKRPATIAGYIIRHIQKFGYREVMDVLCEHNWAEIYPEASSVTEIGRPAGKERYFTPASYPTDTTYAMLFSSDTVIGLRKVGPTKRLAQNGPERGSRFPMTFEPHRRATKIEIELPAKAPAHADEERPVERVDEAPTETTEPPVAPHGPLPKATSAMLAALIESTDSPILISRNESGMLVVEAECGTSILAA